MRTKQFTVVAACLCLVGAGVAQAKKAAWQNELTSQLEKIYPLSKRGRLAPDRITTAGAVLVLQQQGITADLSSNMTIITTDVGPDGQVAQSGAFQKKGSRVLEPGETVYLTDIDVKDRLVRFIVLTCNTFEVNVKGSTRQTRYKAAVDFTFDEGYLSSANVEDVKKAIASVFLLEEEAGAAKRIGLGQSPDEVEKILGTPERIIDLGSKLVYVYPDMRVIFLDNKLSDVE